MQPDTYGEIAQEAASMPVVVVQLPAESVIGKLANMEALLAQLVQLSAKELAQETLDTRSDFRTGQTYTVDRKGRRFFYVFSSAAIVGCTTNVDGTGLYTFTIAAGWNQIAAPDGTVINPPAATTATVLFRASNWQIGSAL